jgi:hypothetical protein
MNDGQSSDYEHFLRTIEVTLEESVPMDHRYMRKWLKRSVPDLERDYRERAIELASRLGTLIGEYQRWLEATERRDRPMGMSKAGRERVRTEGGSGDVATGHHGPTPSGCLPTSSAESSNPLDPPQTPSDS